MPPGAGTAVRRLASLILERRCPLCGGPRESVLCGWCAARLYPDHAGRSRAGLAPFPVGSAFLHSGSARELVILLKFGGRRDLGGTAARLLLESGCPLPPPGEAVVPVPLCGPRLRERGYNQAAEIAAGIASACGARMVEALARETRPPQVGLGGEERRRNVTGAFMPAAGWRFRDVGHWIVDDVLTTGSTLREAGRVLREMGCRVAGAITLTYRPESGVGIITGSAGFHGMPED